MQREGKSKNREATLPIIPLEVSQLRVGVPQMSGKRSAGLGGDGDRKTPVTRNDLLPGEVICSKCKGHGFLPSTVSSMEEWQYQCDKCDGEGKVDWVTNVMGVPPPKVRSLKGNWTMEMEEDIKAMYDVNLPDEIMKSLGEELAKKTDQEIIESLQNISVTKSKIK